MGKRDSFYFYLEYSCSIRAVGFERDARLEIIEHMCSGCCFASGPISFKSMLKCREHGVISNTVKL